MKIGLFIPCYVDAVYPEVGLATYKLLKHLGLDVTYPQKQTCCGGAQRQLYCFHAHQLPSPTQP